ncbi:hypothetical protein LCGC14_1982140 [marine sediment metagenome]|uniref:Uncharacterized protein n=1 Tax=marine sediment metagenome TaxID=412755 RepID=A0A0F9FWR5_9ZZZZ
MHIQARLSGERGGISLIEILVVIPTMLVVFGAVLSIYQVSVHAQDRTENRVRSQMQQQRGLHRITRDLRHATAIDAEASDIIDAWMPDGLWARYDCSSPNGDCQRLQGTAEDDNYDLTGPVVIEDVRNHDVFAYEPDPVNPIYVTIRVVVRVKGANNPIVLSDGVNLRNLTRLPGLEGDWEL